MKDRCIAAADDAHANFSFHNRLPPGSRAADPRGLVNETGENVKKRGQRRPEIS
jgi:hypothetical protein